MKENSLSLSRDVRKVFVHSLKFARMQFHMIISDAVNNKNYSRISGSQFMVFWEQFNR